MKRLLIPAVFAAGLIGSKLGDSESFAVGIIALLLISTLWFALFGRKTMRQREEVDTDKGGGRR
jgi:hypothetical protein